MFNFYFHLRQVEHIIENYTIENVDMRLLVINFYSFPSELYHYIILIKKSIFLSKIRSYESGWTGFIFCD